jgi:hydrogenase maturation protease
MPAPKATVALIGLGNLLKGDDGVGVRAVRAVQEEFAVHPDLAIVDGGTAGLGLLSHLEGRVAVLCVDAVLFGKEPGYIGIIEDEAIPAAFGPAKLSLHHVGLPELLAAARLVDSLPEKISLIAVEPESLDVGLELSAAVQGKLPKVVAIIAAKLQEWGVTLTRRGPSP